MTVKNKNINYSLVPAVDCGASVSNKSNINYNTYLMLTPLFKALIISSSVPASGKYVLKVTDNKLGFYFYYEEMGLRLKVPLTALFNVNDKTKGILGIKWASAKDCPSRALGLCQLKNESLCYAHIGELQGSKKPHNFLLGMGSYYNSLLCIYYWDLFHNNPEVQKTFYNYCMYYQVDTLRFNLSGDFKGLQDVKILDMLAEHGFKLTGYTARDDLRQELLTVINKHDNIILNGSNMMYNNQFKATESIFEYLTAQHQCKGGCLVNGCLNCYKLKGVVITVLIHGARAGVDLKTKDNCALISWAFNLNNIDITAQDLMKGQDLFKNVYREVNKCQLFDTIPAEFLKVTKGGSIKFLNHSAVIRYIQYLIKSAGAEPQDFRGEF